MERYSYFIRRLLLMIPTLLGVTILVFILCLFVPGGPIEQAMAEMRGMGAGGGEAGVSAGGNGAAVGITEDYRKVLEKQFHRDKPIPVQYKIWLIDDKFGMARDSYKYSNKTVWQLISEKFPISLTFGITSFVLTYLICIPLGIAKALKNGTPFDGISSIVVLAMYAIPAFAFGMILKTLFCGTSDQFWDLFPIGGFRSENFDELSFWGQVKDQAHHMFLPVLCYIIGNFAFLTLLQKNAMLDQISQDYVRTVLAKGGTMKIAVWRHALRNALIPIATGIGGILSLMFAGSVLIEIVFDIPGIGLLSFDSAVNRDFAVVMGLITLGSLVAMLGRILSDFCYVLIDPRINFGKEA
ncbi:MAG: ABC transporter permease subunit [Verrucomicrobiales bacterium]|nr:ABC transporter permease subunit [Verrucomicrobiales bacterium]